MAAMPSFTRYPDLASRDLAGSVVSANDELFAPRQNLIMPLPAVHAADEFGHTGKVYDGWETRRRREPGHDWAIVRLGAPGTIRRVEIDTNHFKGNFPDRASIEGCLRPGAGLDALADAAWTELLPSSKLRASHRHIYSKALRPAGVVSHVRLNIFPDGGISRLRVHGTVAPA